MQKSSVLFRDDTFLGICEALGEDFHFNPLYLRVTLGVLLLWNPAIVVGSYLAAGVAVAVSRFVSPNPRIAAAPAIQSPADAKADAQGTFQSGELAVAA